MSTFEHRIAVTCDDGLALALTAVMLGRRTYCCVVLRLKDMGEVVKEISKARGSRKCREHS